MTKKKVGSILFWISVIWIIGWGVVGSIFLGSAMRSLTAVELSQSIWSFEGPLFILWGASGTTLGAILAGIGLLLRSGAKASTVWKFAIGILLAVIVAVLVIPELGHIAPLFPIGGTLIILFFLGIGWVWAQERLALKASSTTSTDFRFVSYVFMFLATWNTCGIAVASFWKGLEGKLLPPGDPIHVTIFFVLGWLFLFLSHYKSRQRI